ncbi:hypothetical protein E4U52_004868 [Claviceps spartinae]|nr:hypothetical protein E4U52_004868 [Claviceps spartinae]
MSEKQVGLDSSIKGPDLTLHGADHKKRYMEIELKGGSKEYIVLDQQILRMPIALYTHVKDHPEKMLVVKDSWQDVKRDEEPGLWRAACYCLQLVKTLLTWLATTTTRRYKVVGWTTMSVCVQRRLVKAPISNSFQSNYRGSSRAIRRAAKARDDDEHGGNRLRPTKKYALLVADRPKTLLLSYRLNKKNRMHRRVIVRDSDKAIHKASSHQALLVCLEGCIKGYQSLYKTGILHRDISVKNLMISEEGNEFWPHFLIDLDHAIGIDRSDASTERSNGNRAAQRREA